jgi:hypothetical protein
VTETPKATARTCAAGCGQPLTTWHAGADGRLWHPACLPPGAPLQQVLSPAAAARRIAELEAEVARLHDGADHIWTRWFMNAHAGLNYYDARAGIAADLRAIID